MMVALGEIAVGIAGWSYPDWKGIVYPVGRRVDELAYVSGFVDAIEINNTFYRPPSAKNSESWLRRTAGREGFFFTAKLHQDFTHKGKLEEGMVREFYEGFGPLLEARRLRGLLAQFRYDFGDTPGNRRQLGWIVERFGEAFDLIVEVRHRDWQEAEGLAFLEGLGVSVANLDYPVGRGNFQMHQCRVGRQGYFRLHGRNYAAWFSKEAGRDETYDYYYSPEELDEGVGRVRQLAEAFGRLTVIANNHYHGAELANALELKFRLTGRKAPAPEELLREYPRLAAVV